MIGMQLHIELCIAMLALNKSSTPVCCLDVGIELDAVLHARAHRTPAVRLATST